MKSCLKRIPPLMAAGPSDFLNWWMDFFERLTKAGPMKYKNKEVSIADIQKEIDNESSTQTLAP